MPSRILRKYSSPEENVRSDAPDLDINEPFSFEDWSRRNIGIIPNNAEEQYQTYLLAWYGRQKQKLTPSSLRDDYIGLLKRLSVVFRNDSEFRRFTNIDFDDNVQLKLALPAYVRKLKEIAIYYSNKRKAVKDAKLKYNMAGSENAIERVFYEYILKAFTKRDYVLNVPTQSAWNAFPDLSSINKSFSIEIEDIYDDQNYYDKDYAESVEGLYDQTSSNPLLFVLEDIIANNYGGEVPLSATAFPLDESACENSGLIVDQLLQEANEKYIGTTKYYITGGYFEYDSYNLTIPFIQGNNHFYWFSGEYFEEAPHQNFKPIALSSNDVDWESHSTAGSEFSSSDIIFVKKGDDVSGAWFSHRPTIPVKDSMRAQIENGKTFKYPYPSYGLSAETLNWTGPGLKEYDIFSKSFFPNDAVKKTTLAKIKDLYWNNTSPLSTVRGQSIHDTNLVDQGAYDHKKFDRADKVWSRTIASTDIDNVHDLSQDEVFTGQLDVEWLFNFTKFEAPIKDGENYVHYPMGRYEQQSDLKLQYEFSDPVPLTAVNVPKHFTGSVAGDRPETSDMIYKLGNWNGPIVEAAWLYGPPLSAFNRCDRTETEFNVTREFVNGSLQAGLTFKAESGKSTQFIYTGKGTDVQGDFINNMAGLGGYLHDASCEYKKQNPLHPVHGTDTFLESARNPNQWKTCNCKAIYYSPMGHPGSQYSDYGSNADFIVVDTNYPLPFTTIDDWVGSDGLNYTESKDFAWFKLDDSIDINAGWGKGTWQAGDGGKFKLEPGTRYRYYRASINQGGDLLASHTPQESPYVVIKHCYHESVIKDCDCVEFSGTPQWKKAILRDGIWVDGGATNMILGAGTFYRYDQQEKHFTSSQILTAQAGGITVNLEDVQTVLDGGTLSIPDTHNKVSEFISTNNIVNSVLKNNYLETNGLTALNWGYGYQVECYDSINYVWTVPLDNPKPYWAKGSFGENVNTFDKRIMYGGEGHPEVFDYLFLTNPEPSDLYLSDEMFIKYERSDCADTSCFVWTESLEFDVVNETKRWNKIVIDNCNESPILHWITNGCHRTDNPKKIPCPKCCSVAIDKCGCDMNEYLTTVYGVSATASASDIFLTTRFDNEPVFVNYFARETFNLPLTVVDTTFGLPPTGGRFVPPTSGVYANAQLPYHNLPNQLDPIAAFRETPLYQYTKKDVGFYTPERLGYTRLELNTKAMKFLLDTSRSASSVDVVLDPTEYDSSLYEVKEADSRELKKMSYCIGGQIADGIRYQEFVPYQSSFESLGLNKFGIENQSDLIDPWIGDKADQPRSEISQNFRNENIVNCGPNNFYGGLQNAYTQTDTTITVTSSISAVNYNQSDAENNTLVGDFTGNDSFTFTGFPEFTGMSYTASFELVVPTRPSQNITLERTFDLDWNGSSYVLANTAGASSSSVVVPIASSWGTSLLNILIEADEDGVNIDTRIINTSASELNCIGLPVENFFVLGTQLTASTALGDSYSEQYYVYDLSGNQLGDFNLFNGYDAAAVLTEIRNLSIPGMVWEAFDLDNMKFVVDNIDIVSSIYNNGPLTYGDVFEYPNGVPHNSTLTVTISGYTENHLYDVDIDTQTSKSEMSQWKSDIFGNQYGLYKQVLTGDSIDDVESKTGILWVRDLNNAVGRSSAMLDDVYDNYNGSPVIGAALNGSGIVDFDIFYDTLFILTENHLVVERINTDFTDGNIYSIADNSISFNIPDISQFGGWWLDESTKTVSFAFMSGGSVPYVYEYDIDNVHVNKIYPSDSNDIAEWTEDVASSWSHKFTFNSDSNTYNYTYLDTLSSVDYVITSNLNLDNDSIWRANGIKAIGVPDLTDKKLIRSRYRAEELLLVFEKQVIPNEIYTVTMEPNLVT